MWHTSHLVLRDPKSGSSIEMLVKSLHSEERITRDADDEQPSSAGFRLIIDFQPLLPHGAPDTSAPGAPNTPTASKPQDRPIDPDAQPS